MRWKLLIVISLVFLNSCSMHWSLTGATIPPDAKTFSVQYFKNNAPLAGPTVSQTFTDALRDYIASQSRLVLVTNGDLDFQGSITGFTIAPLAASTASTGQSSLTRLTLTVEVTYTDKNDSKKVFTASFSRYADYPSSSSLSSMENDLLQQINKQLVQDIFDKAFNNW